MNTSSCHFFHLLCTVLFFSLRDPYSALHFSLTHRYLLLYTINTILSPHHHLQLIIYIKMDLALNNLQRLICHKTKPNRNRSAIYTFFSFFHRTYFTPLLLNLHHLHFFLFSPIYTSFFLFSYTLLLFLYQCTSFSLHLHFSLSPLLLNFFLFSSIYTSFFLFSYTLLLFLYQWTSFSLHLHFSLSTTTKILSLFHHLHFLLSLFIYTSSFPLSVHFFLSSSTLLSLHYH